MARSTYHRSSMLATVGQYRKYHTTLCLSLQNVAQALLPVSLGTIEKMSQEKMKTMFMQYFGSEGQTKSIMVFFIG